MKAFAAIGLTLLLHGAAQAQTGLGEGRNEESIAADVNIAGDVVGEVRDSDGIRHAILSRQGKLIKLGTLGGSDSYATAVNHAGVVIGGALNGSNAWRAFSYDEENGMRDLGTLGGRSSLAIAINRDGAVAGYADADSRSFHAFIHDGKQMKDLGTLGGRNSYATALNSHGHVVGAAQNANGFRRAFLYTPEQGMKELPALGGRVSAAMAINDKGVVVGASETADRKWHAVLWDGDRVVDLGAMIAKGNSYATGINRDGTVVGTIRSGDNAPLTFVYENGAMRILPNRNSLYLTTRITDDGQIIGAAYTGHKYQAFARPVRPVEDNSWKIVDWLTFFTILFIAIWCIRHIWRDYKAGLFGPRRQQILWNS
jgi:probable HAF family extracellular repeat protein